MFLSTEGAIIHNLGEENAKIFGIAFCPRNEKKVTVDAYSPPVPKIEQTLENSRFSWKNPLTKYATPEKNAIFEHMELTPLSGEA